MYRIYSPAEVFHVLAHKPRRGWIMRDIKDPETTYEHSDDMRLMALELAPRVSKQLDPFYCSELCAAHDLSDFAAADITPHENVSAKNKAAWERSGLWHMYGTTTQPEVTRQMMMLWREFETGRTPGARFANQLDGLQLAKQTLQYEQTQDKNMPDMWAYANRKISDPVLKNEFNRLFGCRPADIDQRPLTQPRKLSSADDVVAIEASMARLTDLRKQEISAEREAAFSHYPLITSRIERAKMRFFASSIGRRFF